MPDCAPTWRNAAAPGPNYSRSSATASASPRCTSSFARLRGRRSAEALFEQVERRDREGAHVVDPVGAAGLDRDRALDPANDGDAGMPGGMAVAAAGRPGGASLADRPGGGEPLLDF